MERPYISMDGQGKMSFHSDGVHWRLPNLRLEPQTTLQSPLFHFNGDWLMTAYPNGFCQLTSPGWIGVSVFGDMKDPNVGSRFRLHIIAGPRSEVVKAQGEKVDDNHYVFKNILKTPCIRTSRDYFNHLSRGNLHVVFYAEKEPVGNVQEEKQSVTDVSTQTEEVKEMRKLELDLNDLYLNSNFSDVVLKVKDKEFKAHRCILAARSPVFMAMMTHEMKEKKTGIVHIEDVDEKVFPLFLNFLYTGRMEDLSPKNATELYAIADKYQVDEMKRICHRYMWNNISVDNFCDILSLSLQHDEVDLKEACIQFFANNSLDISMTSNWQTFLSENPILGNEMFIKYMRFNKQE